MTMYEYPTHLLAHSYFKLFPAKQIYLFEILTGITRISKGNNYFSIVGLIDIEVSFKIVYMI